MSGIVLDDLDSAEPLKRTVDVVWDRMDDNERNGARFGLFPAWVEEFDLDTTEYVELIAKSEDR